jgi:hypothetical protein
MNFVLPILTGTRRRGTERLGTYHICLSLSEAGEQVQGHERGHHQRPQLQGDYTVKNLYFLALTARTDAEISIRVQCCSPEMEIMKVQFR